MGKTINEDTIVNVTDANMYQKETGEEQTMIKHNGTVVITNKHI